MDKTLMATMTSLKRILLITCTITLLFMLPGCDNITSYVCSKNEKCQKLQDAYNRVESEKRDLQASYDELQFAYDELKAKKIVEKAPVQPRASSVAAKLDTGTLEDHADTLISMLSLDNPSK